MRQCPSGPVAAIDTVLEFSLTTTSLPGLCRSDTRVRLHEVHAAWIDLLHSESSGGFEPSQDALPVFRRAVYGIYVTVHIGDVLSTAFPAPASFGRCWPQLVKILRIETDALTGARESSAANCPFCFG